MGKAGLGHAYGARRFALLPFTSVRARLIFGYVALGTMLTGGSMLSVSAITRHSNQRRSERSQVREELIDLESEASSATEEAYSYALFHVAEEGNRGRNKMEDTCAAADQLRAHVSKVSPAPSLASAVREDACHFRDVGVSMLGTVERDGQLSNQSYQAFEESADRLMAHIAELNASLKSDADKDRAAMEWLAERGLVLIGLLSVLLAALMGRKFADSVARPLTRLRDALRTFGSGKWDATIRIDSTDELGQLAQAFREMATSTRQHVHALDKAQVHLNDIFASMGELLIVCDGEGIIRSTNPACLMTSGFAATALVGKPATFLFVDVPFAPAMDKGTYRLHGESELKAKDGTRIPVRLSASRLHGDAAGTLIVAENLSERQRLELELRQAQKMDAIGRLAGGVAHDFNNMLSIILGYSGMLLDEMSEADPSYEALSEIRGAGERSLELTRQLLSFSRRQPPALVTVDVNGVLENTARMMKRTLGSNVRLSVSLADQPCHVRAELGQMDTLLLNLVLNARDAMPEGGVIQVSTELSAGRSDASPLELGLGKGPHVVMVVRDDGVGMDARTLDRIFEPFFTTKADGDGTGLGLATAFGMVERSGGTITVESEVGVGTTFRVHWPCATMDAEDEATPQSLRGAA